MFRTKRFPMVFEHLRCFHYSTCACDVIFSTGSWDWLFVLSWNMFSCVRRRLFLIRTSSILTNSKPTGRWDATWHQVEREMFSLFSKNATVLTPLTNKCFESVFSNAFTACLSKTIINQTVRRPNPFELVKKWRSQGMKRNGRSPEEIFRNVTPFRFLGI